MALARTWYVSLLSVQQEAWQTHAKRHLKAELKRSSVGYADLAKRRTEMGLPESDGSVTVKINRGAFPAWFYFAAMKAVGRIRCDCTSRTEDAVVSGCW